MFFQKALKSLFGRLIDIDLRDFVSFKIFGTNDLVGFICDRFFKAIGADRVGAFQPIRKVKRRAEPVRAEGAFELVDMEHFHIL